MRNVRRPIAYESLFKRFTETSHPDFGRPIFATQREFLCFLAVLGFHTGDRTPVSAQTAELDGRVFDTSEVAKDLMYSIALAGTKEADILHPDREDAMVTVFEEYAATGFKVMDGWLIAQPDDHVGDQALLGGLRRDGFLGSIAAVGIGALQDVEF